LDGKTVDKNFPSLKNEFNHTKIMDYINSIDTSVNNKEKLKVKKNELENVNSIVEEI
jgi:hypothetical protein